MLVGAAWLFLGILENVAGGDPLVGLDDLIYQAVGLLREVEVTCVSGLSIS